MATTFKDDVYDQYLAGNSVGGSVPNIIKGGTKGSVTGLSLYRSDGRRDEDFFTITLSDTGMTNNYIKVNFANISGMDKAKVELLDNSSKEISGYSLITEYGSKVGTLNLEGLDPGTYYFHIRADKYANPVLPVPSDTGWNGWSNSPGVHTNYTITYDLSNYTDKYEPSSKDDPSIVIGSKTTGSLAANLHKNDADYYKITLPNGTDKNFIRAAFSKITGKQTLALVDDNDAVVASKTIETDGFSASQTLKLDLSAVPAGDYRVKVTTEADKGRANYSLSWNTVNYWPAKDSKEGANGNNTLNAATPLTTESGSLAGMTLHDPADADYYKFTLNNAIKSDKNLIKVTFPAAVDDSSATVKLLDMTQANPVSIADASIERGVALINLNTIDKTKLKVGNVYAIEVKTNTTKPTGANGKYSVVWDTKYYGTAIDKYDKEATTLDKHNNETSDKATTLAASGSLSALSIHDETDVDWYKFNLANIGTAKNTVKTTFTKATGTMNVELFKDPAAAAIDSGTAISLNGLAAGDYYVKVSGADKAESLYNLVWDGKNYGPVIDKYDKTSTPTAATTPHVYTAGNGSDSALTIHDIDDEDYYTFDLQNRGTSKNYVQVTYPVANGDLNLELLDQNNQAITEDTSANGKIRFDLTGKDAGTYKLHITGGKGTWSSTAPDGTITTVTKPNNTVLNTYSVAWDMKNYGPKVDSYDSKATTHDFSDTQGNVKLATKGSYSGTIHSDDDKDYYTITTENLGVTGKNYVSVKIPNGGEPLNVTLTKPDGTTTITPDTSTSGIYKFDLGGADEGDYTLYIDGAVGSEKHQGSYSITWDGKNYGLKPDIYDAMVPEGATQANPEDLTKNGTKPKGSFAGNIHSPKDTGDYYTIKMDNRGWEKNTIAVTSQNAEDLSITVTPSTGTALTANADGKFVLTDKDTYTVAITRKDDAKNFPKYTIAWDATNYGPVADAYDKDGTNSTPEDFTGKKTGSVAATIHDDSDVDIFKIHFDNYGNAKNTIKMALTGKTGENLTMGLFTDAAGTQAATNATVSSDGKTIQLSGATPAASVQPGDYYIKVSGGTTKAQNAYKLTWNTVDYGPKKDMYDTRDKDTNQTIAGATVLPGGKKGNANATISAPRIINAKVTDDIDFYKINLPNRGVSDKNFIQVKYNDAAGRLTASLYPIVNGTLDASGAIKATSTTGGVIKFDLGSTIAKGDYALKVLGAAKAQNSYSIAYDTTNYGPKADRYDTALTNNNTESNAAHLAVKGSFAGTIHEDGDVDYYDIDLRGYGRDKNIVTVKFDQTKGNLTAELTDSTGNTLTDDTSDGLISFNLKDQSTGHYTLKVSGEIPAGETTSIVQNSYTLGWDGTDYGPGMDIYDKRNSGNTQETSVKASTAKTGSITGTIHNESDEDWYTFTKANGDQIKMTATFTGELATGADKMTIGAFVPGASTAVSSLAYDSDNSLPGKDVYSGTIDIAANGKGDAKSLMLKVAGVDKNQGKYTLSWTQQPQAAAAAFTQSRMASYSNDQLLASATSVPSVTSLQTSTTLSSNNSQYKNQGMLSA